MEGTLAGLCLLIRTRQMLVARGVVCFWGLVGWFLVLFFGGVVCVFVGFFLGGVWAQCFLSCFSLEQGLNSTVEFESEMREKSPLLWFAV